MINLDVLFNLFPLGDTENDSISHMDITEKPIYKLGMYQKLLLNFINFKKKVVTFFKETNAELSVEEMEEAGAFVAYNRAWFYINQINLENLEHINAIKKYSSEELNTSLELGIKYFQHSEEYEKCAHILKILKISKES